MRVALVTAPIDAGALLAEVAAAGNGATLLFVGTVRDLNDGRPVTGIEYAAYAAMAERELAAIAGEAAARFGTEDIGVVHRTGRLGVGEASVAIAVAHARRAQCYEASRYVIEELKKRVPIWKREEYVDGTREWVDPTRHPAAAERRSEEEATVRGAGAAMPAGGASG
ncbi:MAG TPA: molybdenum cofactor biosynthesis protein MoaE [Gemmatimonadaceae bacterium]|nr:molybdenum cofactor biosynthesis protein MoaE [Gemmatimonadaceae bacterium]